MAKWVLPFVLKRRVAIEVVYDSKPIYMRHPPGCSSSWFYIKEEGDLVRWAGRHAWSFHPHIGGQEDWWFVMDVDSRGKNMTYELDREVALVLAGIFECDGKDYLIKFSGDRGFHFIWKWDMAGISLKGRSRWFEAKEKVRRYREMLEDRLRLDRSLSKRLAKVVDSGCPYTLTNSIQADCRTGVLLDANILHKSGTIRSPFSIHPGTKLVSVPLKGFGGLKQFELEDARPEVVLRKRWDWVRLPINCW